MVPTKRTPTVILLLRLLIVVGFVSAICVTKQEAIRSLLMPSRYAVKTSTEIVPHSSEPLAKVEEKSRSRKKVADIVGEWRCEDDSLRFKLLISPDAMCQFSVTEKDGANESLSYAATIGQDDSGRFQTSFKADDPDYRGDVSLRLDDRGFMWAEISRFTGDPLRPELQLLKFHRVE